MPYTPKTWTNTASTPITADELNRMETGVVDSVSRSNHIGTQTIATVVGLDAALLGKVEIRRYIAGAWQVRGSTSTAFTAIWLKPTAADPDPLINATFFLQGTDILLKATA